MSEPRRRNRLALLGILGIGLLGTVVALFAVVAVLTPSAPTLEEPSVLEITLDGGYAEGAVEDPFAELGLSDNGSSLYDLVRGLEAAATDDNIVAVRLDVRSPMLGLAQQQELAQAVAKVRDVGKPVVAHLVADMVTNGRYYAASQADEVWTTPEAFWMIQGLQADVEFYRGTLDKLQIEPDVIMFKEYKSAGETFLNTERSEPMREALTAVLGDAQRMWVEGVAARRELSVDAVQGLVDAGAMAPGAAKDAGLVDAFGYADEVTDALTERLGFDEYTKIELDTYLETLAGPSSEGRIALIFGEGPIVASGGDDGNPFASGSMISGPSLAKDIRDATESDRVKAIVLRVNSPGGSAVGSDLVWREIQRARDQGIPVVVSMSSVAGSGGYWISMGADAIVAQPATITGSIGVVFTKLNVRGFYEWLGANVDSVSFAENSNLMSPYHSLDEAQYDKLESIIGVMYESFVNKVADGRGMSFEEVEPLAHGRIWSGEDALEHALVDRLGGLDEAFALAAEKASLDLEGTDVEVFPEAKSLFERLAEGELSVTTAPPTEAQVRSWIEQLAEPRASV
ncbi:MAG: signal peptide peptidase SppA, partial [Myxococcota bacterium]